VSDRSDAPPSTDPEGRTAPGTLAAVRERRLRLIGFALAVVGVLLGAWMVQHRLSTDPLADIHAYYDAGARLNAGLPLYPPDADTNAADFYRYPPLLAIAFRPLAAFLSFEGAAVVWMTVCVATFAFTLVRLGLRRYWTWIAVAILGLPIAWSLLVGQAQVPVTYLLTLGSPWAVALAANLKVLPALVAVYWLGRRERMPLMVFGAWMVGLGAFQLVLEPQATIDFFRTFGLGQVGEVNNLSPYAISPLLWAALVAVGVVVALRLAPGRYGWAAAVTLSVLATPRLLAYLLMTLLAGMAHPRPQDPVATRGSPPTT